MGGSHTGQYAGESSDEEGAGTLATRPALSTVLSAHPIPKPHCPSSLVLELAGFTAEASDVHKG